jgi:hypothetical protein
MASIYWLTSNINVYFFMYSWNYNTHVLAIAAVNYVMN